MAPPDDDATDSEEGGVLAPEELDITDDEHVVEIDEGRFVISPGDSAPTPPEMDDESENEDETTSSPEAKTAPREPDRMSMNSEVVHKWLSQYVASADAQYGIDVTATFDGSIAHQELFSNDVVTTFENLLVWYAQHAGDNTPVEDALGILLMESSVPIRYPSETVEALVATHNLDPDDDIAVLLDAISDDGVRFPPDP